MPFVQNVGLIFHCDMICGSFIFIFLTNGSGTQNCAKKHCLRILFLWLCSWLHLVFSGVKSFLI